MATLAPGDSEIIYWLTKLGVAIADDLAFLTGRNVQIMWRRLRVLKALDCASFRRHPDNPFQHVWFPMQKGWDKAFELGFINTKLSATDEKSALFIAHDLILSKFLIALVRLEREGTIQDLKFTRSFRQLYDRWGDGNEAHVNPDAFFSFWRNGVYPCFFVEIERGSQHHYDNGRSDRIRKMESYALYPLDRFQERFGTENFFVLVLMPTQKTATNFIDALRKSDDHRLRTRKFWAGDFSAINHLSERVFMTPKDKAVSVLDAADFK